MTLIIGFGYAAQNGKDTAAQAIIEARSPEHKIKRYAFADLLKVEVFHALVNRADPFWTFIERFNGTYYQSVLVPKPVNPYISDPAAKVAWINENKVSLRSILQIYGSEYRRAQDPFYWVRLLGGQILVDAPQVALITDVRFLNEIFFVKANDGFTVKVVRDGFDNGVSDHQSEQQLKEYGFDYTILVPDGNLEELKTDAVAVFDAIVDSLTPENLTTEDFSEDAFTPEAEVEVAA